MSDEAVRAVGTDSSRPATAIPRLGVAGMEAGVASVTVSEVGPPARLSCIGVSARRSVGAKGAPVAVLTVGVTATVT
jgi:hypothetical protein